MTAAPRPAAAAAARPDPALAQRVALARDFIFQFKKGLKALSMYAHDLERAPVLVAPAFEALTAALAGGALVLRCKPAGLHVGTESVWTSDGSESVPFRLYREGLRTLGFVPGIEVREFARFAVVLAGLDPAADGGLAEQLWSEGLSHVTQSGSTGRSPEQDRPEFQSELAALIASFPSSPPQAGKPLELAPGFADKVQQKIRRDEELVVPTQLSAWLMRMLKGGQVQDPRQVGEILGQLAGRLVRQRQFGPLLEQLLDFQQNEVLAKEIGSRLGSDEEVLALAIACRTLTEAQLPAARAVLLRWPQRALHALLRLLPTLQGHARLLLLELAVRLGNAEPELLEGRLQEPTWAGMKDAVALLAKARPQGRAALLERLLAHADPVVRSESLQLLGVEEWAHRFVLQSTTSPDPEFREVAFHTLVKMSPNRATTDLLRLPKLPDWTKRSDSERALIYRCLGRTGTGEALKHLTELANEKKPLIGGQAVLAKKLLAIEGLGAMGSLPAYKLLQALAADPANAKEQELQAAVRKASIEAQRKLQGGADPQRASEGGASTDDEEVDPATLRAAQRASEAQQAQATLLLNSLQMLVRSSKMYGADNAVFDKPLASLMEAMNGLQGRMGTCELALLEGTFFQNGQPIRVDAGQVENVMALGQAMDRCRVGALTWDGAVATAELKQLVHLLASEPSIESAEAGAPLHKLERIQLIGARPVVATEEREDGLDTVDLTANATRTCAEVVLAIESAARRLERNERLPGAWLGRLSRDLVDLVTARRGAALTLSSFGPTLDFGRHGLNTALLSVALGIELQLTRPQLRELAMTAFLAQVASGLGLPDERWMHLRGPVTTEIAEARARCVQAVAMAALSDGEGGTARFTRALSLNQLAPLLDQSAPPAASELLLVPRLLAVACLADGLRHAYQRDGRVPLIGQALAKVAEMKRPTVDGNFLALAQRLVT